MPFHIGLIGRLELSLHIILKGISNFAFDSECHLNPSCLKDLERLRPAVPCQNHAWLMGNDILGGLDSCSLWEV